MSDNPTGQTATAPDNSGQQQTPVRTFTQSELDAIITERLRRHEEKYADYGSLKEKASKYDQQEQANLSELEKAQNRVKELEAFKAELDATNLTLGQILGREMEAIPEDKRELIAGSTPREKLADIARLKALGLFTQKPQAPDLEGGVRGDSRKSVLLNAQEQAVARRLGLTDEQYVKYKEKK